MFHKNLDQFFEVFLKSLFLPFFYPFCLKIGPKSGIHKDKGQIIKEAHINK